MRFEIIIDANKLTIPRNYQHYLQGIIYHSMDANIADCLHDTSDHKLFNYSNLKGDFFSHDNLIIFKKTASFEVSSIKDDIILGFIENINNKGFISFGNYQAPILKITLLTLPKIGKSFNFETISPVTIYKKDDNRKLIFYNPNESAFFEGINSNFQKKINCTDPEPMKFSNISKVKKIVMTYKGGIIECYKFSGTIEVENESYVEKIFNIGLGQKNSAGFGMIKIL